MQLVPTPRARLLLRWWCAATALPAHWCVCYWGAGGTAHQGHGACAWAQALARASVCCLRSLMETSLMETSLVDL